MKTPETINGKTPDEIKKGLECCAGESGYQICHECPYSSTGIHCMETKDLDALAYIQQLEAELEDEKNKNEILIFDNDKLMAEIDQAERERDALMHDVSKCRRCETCAKRRIPIHKCPHFDGGTQYPCWQWRGVCPENTKEENE